MLKISMFLFAVGIVISRPAAAEQIQLLDRGDKSLAGYYTAITNAKQSLDLATYAFEPCHSSTKLLIEEIVKKAKAGVKVRIMLDAYSLSDQAKSGLPAYFAAASANIQLRFYNESSFGLPNDHRSHIKTLVIDGRTSDRLYFVGGRNLTDDYFGLGSKVNYVDQDLLVRGASASTAQKYFDELWDNAAAPVSSGNAANFAASCLAKSARDASIASSVRAQAAGILASIPQRTCGNVKYVLDNPDFLRTNASDGSTPVIDILENQESFLKKRTTRLVLDFLAGVRSDLTAANQFYIPSFKLDAALQRLRSVKANVTFFANATGDVEGHPDINSELTCWMQTSAATDATNQYHVNILTSRGALENRWALSIPGTPWRIHTKSAVRDHKDVLMSSFNFDARSYNINLESGAIISDCPELAADVDAQYEALQQVANSDKSCASCRSEIRSSDFQPGVFCGPNKNEF